jgi:hypothetical protein
LAGSSHQAGVDMFEFDHVLELLTSPSTLGLPEDAVAEFLKLVAAAATGLVVTKVRKHQSGRPLPLPLGVKNSQ